MTAMTTLIRALAIGAALTATAVVTAPAAGAVPGHTSCKDLGALVASEAQARTIAEENRSLPHGTIDDLIHVVQVGGEFFGEPVPAFCQTS
jgi:hypothetical protein